MIITQLLVILGDDNHKNINEYNGNNDNSNNININDNNNNNDNMSISEGGHV